MKRSFLSLFGLFIIILALLYIQWVDFSKTHDDAGKLADALPTQIITVSSTNAGIQVEQEISGLDSGDYKIETPQVISNVKCLISSDDPCLMENNVISVRESDTVTFQYQVSNKSHTFIMDTWIQIPELSFNSTTIEVIESLPFDGIWTSAAVLEGQIQLDNIVYFQFKGENGAFPLFRTEQPTLEKSNDVLTIFGEGSDSSFQEILNMNFQEKTNEFGSWNIILSDYIPSYYEKGLIVLPSTTSNQQIKEALLKTYVKENYQITSEFEDELAIVIASILFEEELESFSHVYNQVVLHFTKNEVSQLQELILKQPTIPITPEWLDEQIYQIKGLKTTFISESIQNEKAIQLLLFDPRPITIQSSEEQETLSLIEDGLRYYPFEETMNQLDYTVTFMPEEQLIAVQGKEENYRFYTNEPVYFHNEEKYSLLQIPVTQFNDLYYIEEGWLRRLFDVEVSVNDKFIKLVQS